MATAKVLAELDNYVLTASAVYHTSSVWDLSSGYGGELYIRYSCQAVVPTTLASSSIRVSPNQTDWYDFGGPLQAGSGSLLTSSYAIPIPISVSYVRVDTGGNVGTNMTVFIQGTQVTRIQ